MLFFLFIEESKKKVLQVTKNIKQHKSFNTDNKSAYLEGFMKDLVTLKTGVMVDENSALHHIVY